MSISALQFKQLQIEERDHRIANLKALLAAKQDALVEAHREIAERQRLLDETIEQIEHLKATKEAQG